MDSYIVPVQGKLEIHSHVGPFDQGIAALQRAGVPLWEAEELFLARRLFPTNHSLNTGGSWVANPFIYATARDADILVVRRPLDPVLQNPAAAAVAHSEGKEYRVQNFTELRERASPDPETARRDGVFLLERNGVRSSISLDAFGEYGLTVFLGGTQVAPYSKHLRSAKITEVPLYVVDADYARRQRKPFARSLWVGSLGGRSDLGGGQDLHNQYGRVSGVRFVVGPAEQAAPDVPLEARVESR